jgi:hypothetical protein
LSPPLLPEEDAGCCCCCGGGDEGTMTTTGAAGGGGGLVVLDRRVKRDRSRSGCDTTSPFVHGCCNASSMLILSAAEDCSSPTSRLAASGLTCCGGNSQCGSSIAPSPSSPPQPVFAAVTPGIPAASHCL